MDTDPRLSRCKLDAGQARYSRLAVEAWWEDPSVAHKCYTNVGHNMPLCGTVSIVLSIIQSAEIFFCGRGPSVDRFVAHVGAAAARTGTLGLSRAGLAYPTAGKPPIPTSRPNVPWVRPTDFYCDYICSSE